MLGGCFVAVGTAAKTRSAQSNLFRVLYMGKCPFVEQSSLSVICETVCD